MFGCNGVSFVERIEEGGIEGAEGEFVDYVGEVECCDRNPTISNRAIDINHIKFHKHGMQKNIPL